MCPYAVLSRYLVSTRSVEQRTECEPFLIRKKMTLMNCLFLTDQSKDIQRTVKLTHELVISISVSE